LFNARFLLLLSAPLFHSEEYHITLFFPVTASQFEEVLQSCHWFGEEMPASLKKFHRADAGLEKSPAELEVDVG
jgi:hypothetical protein